MYFNVQLKDKDLKIAGAISLPRRHVGVADEAKLVMLDVLGLLTKAAGSGYLIISATEEIARVIQAMVSSLGHLLLIPKYGINNLRNLLLIFARH